MVDDVRIRALAAGDRAAWDPLWQGYLAFYGESVDDEVTDTTWHRLVGDEATCGGLAATVADELIGFAHYLVHPTTWDTRSACYLEDLFVSEAARGTGAGRALVEGLMQLARDNDWTQIHWVTHDDNVVAQRLYDRIAKRTDWVRYEIDV